MVARLVASWLWVDDNDTFKFGGSKGVENYLSKIKCEVIDVAVDNDLTFFTNEPDRDLYSRFCNILKGHTQFFDILVGYFRTSGFFKLYPAMCDVEKIRILVGLNVDAKTFELIEKSKEGNLFGGLTIKEAKDKLGEAVEEEFADEQPSLDSEQGVRHFIEWLRSGKLEMRMYMEAPIHAKVYVMRKDPEHVPDQYGSVITGSSNFSLAGLQNNLEFNVELKNSHDVKFALSCFEKLWEKSEDISAAYIEAVNARTWLRDDITPYEIYLKTLYEFFKEEINTDKEELAENLLPDGYMRLQYQLDAVLQAKKTLEAYNGVFISDVVGLGKTYICAMLAKLLHKGKKLIVCPPVLIDYWNEVLWEFDVAAEVVSLGKLDSVLEKADKYQYIFVDEAHRFRNAGTEAFSALHAICFQKKVVLISATPINNYTSDIENQIYLFQPKHNSNIVGVKNLEAFFARLRKKQNAFEKGSAEYMTMVSENSEIIRDKLLRHIMIRRTRSEVAKYYAEDMKAQGLSFPKLGAPKKIIYEFDELTDKVFMETVGVIKDFSYARYKPLTYLKNKDGYETMQTAQQNMGGFMKGILVKRLESSFYAFRKTLGRFVESYEKFLGMLAQGDVYISKKINVYDLMDNGEDDKLLHYIETEDVMHFPAKAFSAGFVIDLNKDLEKLRYLYSLWQSVKDDPKLTRFTDELKQNSILKNSKKIIFTESQETASYLKDELAKIYGGKVIAFSGSSKAELKTKIEDSFNPKRNNPAKDKYDVLVTTDVLAEGINLHRSNIIINYDLPWNPTRIMQRVGRINRVGTAFDEIYVFNFFPTAQASKELPLTARILEKLQAFHDTLGEDYKFLSDEEHPSPQKLFKDLSQNLDAEDENASPELEYLAKIREVRDEEPELFKKIKALPKKAKTGRQSSKIKGEATLTFIRKGALKSFFLAGRNEARGLSFMEAVKYLECTPEEKKIPIDEAYYEQYEENSHAFDEAMVAEEVVTKESAPLAKNDAVIAKTIKAIVASGQLTDDQEATAECIQKAIENGDLPKNVLKNIKKDLKSAKNPVAAFAAIRERVPDNYLHEEKEIVLVNTAKKTVVLSCYLKEK